ncbi:MAG: hypothetical protein C4320_09155 [Armatimonadota bacterium]
MPETSSLPPLERLNDNKPIISPSENWFDSGLTFNSAATYIPGDSSLLELLTGRPAAEDPEGCVALHYRARPKEDPGFIFTRSFIGLSIHTPHLDLIRRLDEPVLFPDPVSEDALDDLGCEDPRVSFVDGTFWMVYCGSHQIDKETWRGSLLAARSDDLINWTKVGLLQGTDDVPNRTSFHGFDNRYFDNLGGLQGDCSRVNNKDGVLFPARILEKVMLLHRPMIGKLGEYAVHLATALEPTGPYIDAGAILRSRQDSRFSGSWAGGGGTPIQLDGNRWLMIGHTGNYLPDGSRYYVLDAFLLDFDRFDPARPDRIVVGRLDGFLRPETEFELHGPTPESVGNVVFSCGNYVHEDWLYIVYGGGDSFTLAARVRLDELVAALESSRSEALSLV